MRQPVCDAAETLKRDVLQDVNVHGASYRERLVRVGLIVAFVQYLRDPFVLFWRIRTFRASRSHTEGRRDRDVHHCRTR